MSRNIIVFYFHGGVPHGYECPLKHKQEIPYTRNNLHSLIDTVFDSGLNVMVYRPSEDGNIILMIDNKRFLQR